MLVIGHRGAAGVMAENTLESFRHAHTVGADMLEFDVQLTRDKVPIVIHDATLRRTHGKRSIVRLSSHDNIKKASVNGHQIATLEDVLDEFFGRVLLNLEMKHQGVAKHVLRIVERYIKTESDWDLILFSSFKSSELYRLRQYQPLSNLALLHNRNPFLFIAHHRKLSLTAAGFNHRYTSRVAIRIAKKVGIFTYVYTVNLPAATKQLEALGVDAVVTDQPEVITKYLMGR